MCHEVGKTNKEYNSLYFAFLNLILCSELHQPSAYGLFLDCSEVATILKCVSKTCLFEQELEKMTKTIPTKSNVIVQTLNILIRWSQAIVNRPVFDDHTEKS